MQPRFRLDKGNPSFLHPLIPSAGRQIGRFLSEDGTIRSILAKLFNRHIRLHLDKNRAHVLRGPKTRARPLGGRHANDRHLNAGY